MTEATNNLLPPAATPQAITLARWLARKAIKAEYHKAGLRWQYLDAKDIAQAANAYLSEHYDELVATREGLRNQAFRCAYVRLISGGRNDNWIRPCLNGWTITRSARGITQGRGAERIFAEKISGAITDRKAVAKAIAAQILDLHSAGMIPILGSNQGARDMGIGDDPALKLMIEVTTAFTGGTSLQVNFCWRELARPRISNRSHVTSNRVSDAAIRDIENLRPETGERNWPVAPENPENYASETT